MVLLHNQRLDHAKIALEHMADKSADATEKKYLKEVSDALGVAEDRIGALEAVVKVLTKKAGITRFDIGYPTGRPYPENHVGDLLG